MLTIIEPRPAYRKERPTSSLLTDGIATEATTKKLHASREEGHASSVVDHTTTSRTASQRKGGDVFLAKAFANRTSAQRDHPGYTHSRPGPQTFHMRADNQQTKTIPHRAGPSPSPRRRVRNRGSRSETRPLVLYDAPVPPSAEHGARQLLQPPRAVVFAAP